MPDLITQRGAEFTQESFLGGMNLLGDDTSLSSNQYRVGFDLTNRYGVLDPVLASVQDQSVPQGIIQECVTFGQYVIIFVSGQAYYRYYTDNTWTHISNFQMDTAAPRYWTCSIPLSLTNYIRLANNSANTANTGIADASNGIQQLNVAGAAQGNIPGLLVQDNINQPYFLYLGPTTGIPTSRRTQNFSQWKIGYTDSSNTVVGPSGGTADSNYDQREYVPIGNCMCWTNGILFIVSSDTNTIYRSVSGRPLDFVVNVTNLLVATQTTVIVNNKSMTAYWQYGGGDATTTSYAVGVGGISCIRPLSTGGIFVSASNATFAVTLNQTPNAPMIFGEYTFNRAFLFNATCLSDRVIFDTIGDTRFIELTGIRSFNAVEQLQNQGRNSVFSATIQAAFGPDQNPTIQDSTATAAILYNNYELYSINTIFGNVIAKYDTINSCWTSFDVQQTNGVSVKIFAKIELTVLRLYAVTTDNKLYILYNSSNTTDPSFRTIGITSGLIYAGTSIRTAHPKTELKLDKTRVILNKITETCDITFTPYANNHLSKDATISKTVTYEAPPNVDTNPLSLPDVNTQLTNVLFTTPDIEQGWKYYGVFSWSGGSFTQFSVEMQELTPNNPENSQELVH